MKCVILSCGCENSLKPLTCRRPGSMLDLFGKPIAEHMIALAARAGAKSVCIETANAGAADILDCGDLYNISLEFYAQSAIRGNAECAAICAGAQDGDAVLVADCDVVCDFDIRACLELHLKKAADATILLYAGLNTLDEAEAVLNADGSVQRIIDRPVWGQNLPGLCLTGVYIISGKALKQAARDRGCDFIRDFFPRLMRENKKVYGYVAEGFWRRVRDVPSYMECIRAALGGDTRLDMGAPQISPGVWAVQNPPEDAVIVPPCYIGGNVSLGSGAVIGPRAVLEKGTVVGRGSLISDSVCLSGMIGQQARISGAVIGRGAAIMQGARVESGSVIGDGAIVGENTVVPEQVRVWAYQEFRDGAEEGRAVINRRLVFAQDGSVGGYANVDVTPELCVLLGSAAGGRFRVGLSESGGSFSELMARAVESGLCASGAQVLRHDGGCMSAAAFAATLYGLERSVFVLQQEDKVRVYIYDSRGMPIDIKTQKGIERAMAGGEQIREDPLRSGASYSGSGLMWAYSASAARDARLAGRPMALRVALSGKHELNRTLAEALSMLGIDITGRRDNVLTLSVENSGMGLVLLDEDGVEVGRKKQQALLSLSEFEYGGGTVVVPEDAPIIIEELAERLGGQVIRAHSGGGKAPQLMFRDGVFAAARLCAWLSVSGRRLKDQVRRIPEFSTSVREVPLNAQSTLVMDRLAAGLGQDAPGNGGSIRVREEQGWVRIMPEKSVIKILTEADSAELAAELCEMFAERVKQVDSQ